MNNTLMIINILSVTYYTFTGIVFIFILLGIIGKFGLFPLNLGIFGIVDGVSLFTSMITLLLNKFIQLRLTFIPTAFYRRELNPW